MSEENVAQKLEGMLEENPSQEFEEGWEVNVSQ